MSGTESIGSAFARTCATHATKTALIDSTTRLAFGDLDRLSGQLARSLLELGIGPGDRVAYQLPNWWEPVVIFLAAARVGAVANPLLPIFRQRELGFILEQSPPRVLFIPGRFRDNDHRALVTELGIAARVPVFVVRDQPTSSIRAFATLLDGGLSSRAEPVAADSLVLLMYTSGTTADPKGVLHSHQTLMAEVESLARVHALTPADKTLMPSPLTHISGLIHATLVPAVLGTAAVLMERWNANEAVRLIARERVTYMVGAPTFLSDLIAASERDQYDLSSLRLFSCGGADVSADLIRRARRTLGCVAKRVYGSTEFPTITTTDADDADTMGIETEGRVIAPAELRIVEGNDHCAAGVIGEVQARGPECFLGYSDPALTRDAVTDDGWFRTGDLGCVDAAGYLRITGRLKDIVIRKGEKLSVREIEDAIAQHPAVAEVVVVAVADTITGERACAVVVLRPGRTLDLTELSGFLTTQGLARQKHPEQLIVRDSLPHTESGKIQRAAVKASIGKG